MIPTAAPAGYHNGGGSDLSAAPAGSAPDGRADQAPAAHRSGAITREVNRRGQSANPGCQRSTIAW